MTERTDCHRPAELDPANYSYIGWMYQGDSEAVLEAIHGAFHFDPTDLDPKKVRNSKHLFEGNYKAKHTCDHCGASFFWGNIYRHRPTNRIIVVGHICAERFGLESRAAWIQEQVRREREAIERRNATVLAANTWLAEYPDLIEVIGPDAHPEHDILIDLKSKLFQWGSLTEKQAGLARKIDLELKTPKVMKPKVDVVEGKGITITGTVISTRSEEVNFGYRGSIVFKMLVEDDRGFRLWGTVPASIGDTERGEKVTFTADVERSKDDSTFGFFKRPRKGQVLEASNGVLVTLPQPTASSADTSHTAASA